MTGVCYWAGLPFSFCGQLYSTLCFWPWSAKCWDYTGATLRSHSALDALSTEQHPSPELSLLIVRKWNVWLNISQEEVIRLFLTDDVEKCKLTRTWEKADGQCHRVPRWLSKVSEVQKVSCIKGLFILYSAKALIQPEWTACPHVTVHILCWSLGKTG